MKSISDHSEKLGPSTSSGISPALLSLGKNIHIDCGGRGRISLETSENLNIWDCYIAFPCKKHPSFSRCWWGFVPAKRSARPAQSGSVAAAQDQSPPQPVAATREEGPSFPVFLCFLMYFSSLNFLTHFLDKTCNNGRILQ